MDPRLEFLLKRHNVRVKREQPIGRDAYLTRLPSHTELALRAGLAEPELLQAVAVQLARLTLGHLDHLDKSGDAKLAEWGDAVLEAARMLIPDSAAEAAEREGLEPRVLAERLGVTELLAQARLEDRLLKEFSADADATWSELLAGVRDSLG
jgi:hypothetical protein